jgi:hypothetical protein
LELGGKNFLQRRFRAGTEAPGKAGEMISPSSIGVFTGGSEPRFIKNIKNSGQNAVGIPSRPEGVGAATRERRIRWWRFCF